jgi:hypothetical protein
MFRSRGLEELWVSAIYNSPVQLLCSEPRHHSNQLCCDLNSFRVMAIDLKNEEIRIV